MKNTLPSRWFYYQNALHLLFLKPFCRGTIEIVTTMICVKIKPNQQNDLYKTKSERSSSFGGFLERDWLPTIWQSDPKNKYHAINSVYYIFSIQVYITFLSIHVHIIIHIVLLCLLGCLFFIFKVLVNFGSQLYCLQLVKHSCNMSTLQCVCGLRGMMCGVKSHDWTLGPWSLPHKQRCLPTFGP